MVQLDLRALRGSENTVTDYLRPDGLVARTDLSTTCRCGNPSCTWTQTDDDERDRIELAEDIAALLFPEMYTERK